MKKILIAGGSGYTGQILVEKFSEKYEVSLLLKFSNITY